MSNCINVMDMMMYCASAECDYHRALTDIEREKKLKIFQFSTDEYIKISAKKDERIVELEARCKELETLQSSIAEQRDSYIKMKIKLESENRRLKAQLDKAMECVDFYADVDNWVSPHEINDPNHKAARIKKELDSIE